MVRKFGFAFVVVMALIVAACGRQVTPNPPGIGPGGAQSGYMNVLFDVAGTLNFSQYSYMIVFDPTGDGQCPGTNTLQSNWAGWDYAILVGGAMAIGTSANVFRLVRSSNAPHAVPAFIPVGTTPTLLQYNPNSDGTGSEFSITFARRIFASPSPAPTSKPSSGATPTPTPLPFSKIWSWNAFTATGSGTSLTFYDSMGAGGPSPNGPQWPCSQNLLNVSQTFDNTYSALFTGTQQDPNGQITTITISNNP
jgi:hypothetical protein